MPTLLVFATEMERDGVFPNGVPAGCDCLITGVGILNAAISLGKVFQNKKYKNAIQIGIAGAYRSSGLQLAEVVNVQSDCLLEFLPWEPNTFISVSRLPIIKNLKCVRGATVLSCSRTEEMGNMRGEIAQIETMEGAAFFQVCKEYWVPAVQIRGISNYASGQGKSEWKIEEALGKLREVFLSYT